MTKIILVLIALISLVSVAAVACGSEDDGSEAMPETAAASPTEVPATETTQAAKTQAQTESPSRHGSGQRGAPDSGRAARHR